jgi:two-component system sensor histidine kinase CpxA
MTLRLPLLAKIIGWFFLNLAVLGFAGWYLLRDQFAFSMLASRTAGDRVAQIASSIVGDLPSDRFGQWDSILAQHSRERGVEFYLFTNDAERLAGPSTPLPPEVHSRLIGATRPRNGDGRPPRAEPPPPRGDGRGARNDGPPRNSNGRPGPDGLPPRDGGGPFPRGERPPRDDGPPFDDDWRPPRFGPDDGPPGVRRVPTRDLPDKVLVQSSNPERYWVFTRVTVRRGSTNVPAALIAMSDSPTGNGLYFDATPLLWAGAGVLLLSALVWFPLVRSITRSIARMRTAAGKLAEGQFDARVETKRTDELGELGAEINRMAGRLSGYVEGQRRFLGDVAHELCAPVARLQMAVGILEQWAKTPADHEHLADVRDEVTHMAGLVNELLQFSRATIGGKQVVLQDVPLKPIAEKAFHREAADPSQVQIEIDDQLSVHAEPDLLQRAFSNLIRNAIRYAGHAGPITVSALQEGGDIFASVTDHGPGVPEDALAKLFDPFYRVDTARTPGVPGGGGTGLGLSIVKTCVEVCGGGVSVRNVAPSGLEVTMRLPAA